MQTLESQYYKTPAFPSEEQIEDFDQACSDAIEEVERWQRQFLIKCGWKYTTVSPGAVWMYVREMPDGRTVMTNAATAMRVAAAEARDRSSKVSPA
jgi:predicted type IV restriction endonuclease